MAKHSRVRCILNVYIPQLLGFASCHLLGVKKELNAYFTGKCMTLIFQVYYLADGRMIASIKVGFEREHRYHSTLYTIIFIPSLFSNIKASVIWFDQNSLQEIITQAAVIKNMGCWQYFVYSISSISIAIQYTLYSRSLVQYVDIVFIIFSEENSRTWLINKGSQTAHNSVTLKNSLRNILKKCRILRLLC